MFQWQVEREGAPETGCAAQLDLAAEKARQLAADRQPQPGTAKPPVGTRISLLKGLENDLLFFRRDADPGIRHLERDHRRRIAELRVTRAPAAARQMNAEPDPA